MADVVQIRVGKHMTGIIGWKAALAEAAERCKAMSDEQVGKVFMDILSRRNYIPDNVAHLYEEAFVREYKKSLGLPVVEAETEQVQVKVLGRGCQRCDRLEQEVMAVLDETGIIAELEHVRDIAEIGRYGVMGTPALVIDGKVKVVGSVPPKSKLTEWIKQAAGQRKQ